MAPDGHVVEGILPHGTKGSNDTKFSQYQLPGGENYREVLFKAPSEARTLLPKGWSIGEWKDGMGVTHWQIKLPNEKKGMIFPKSSYTREEAIEKASTQLQPSRGIIDRGEFKSPHWDEPNILSHARINDRTTPDGKKILFVEEMQSDWARQAREAKVQNTPPKVLDKTETQVNLEGIGWVNKRIFDEKGLDFNAVKVGDGIKEFAKGYREIPEHPLLKNWQEFTLKRLLKKAVDEGYDGISWVTGEQTAERYDLSKQVDSVAIAKTPDDFKKGKIRVTAYKNGNVAIEKFVNNYQEVGDLVGKDLSAKAERELSGDKDQVMYEGQDLKIGGEWAKNLYDKQIPNILKDLTKGEIENIKLPFAGGEIGKQTALIITPEIRARVLGQPIGGGLPERQVAMQERIMNVDMAKDRIAEINNVRKHFLRRIRKYKKGYLKKELAGLPAKYVTVSGGIAPDEALQELRDNYGIDLRDEGALKDYFIGLDKEINELKDIIATNKPKIVSRSEVTILKREQKLTEGLQKKFSGQAKKIIQEAAKTAARLERKAFRAGKREHLAERKPSFGESFTPQQRKEIWIEAMNKGLITKDARGNVVRSKFDAIVKNHPEYTFEQLKNHIINYKGPEPPRGRGGLVPPELNFGKWKDKSALSLSREMLERNIEDVAGKDAPIVKQFITEPIKDNETKRVEFVNSMREDFATKIKQWGIKKNSLEDKLVQRYGEKRIELEELKKLFPDKWQTIVEASAYFRNKYEELLAKINKVRGDYNYDPIPHREDYFRHFQEITSTINNLGIILRKNDIPTEISGLTAIFKPGKPFSTVELQRKGGEFTESAIGGMDNYIDAVSRQIYHLDSVQRARVLEKYIRISGAEGLVKLPNFVANLGEYGNLLSGKKATFDRAFESIFGRPFYSIMKWLKNQTSANMIGGNISSALTNYIPITQAIATTNKKAFAKGLIEGISLPFQKNIYEIDGVRSDFLYRRYPRDAIVLSPLQKTAEAANWMFRSIDMFTSKVIVAGKYQEGIAEGLSREVAMRQADNYAARVITDRSIGQLPNLMGAKSLGIITQFQTEINNVYSFIKKDIPSMNEGNRWQIASALAQFFLYSYIFNNLYEKVTSRRPAIDPIYAVLTLAGASQSGKNRPLGARAWAALKDLRDNLPFVGSIFGGRFPMFRGIPDVEKLAKGETTAGKELAKPLAYLALPFGGGQIKKTIEGLSDVFRGKAVTPKGRTRYKIEQSPLNVFRGTVFGKYAFPEARQYMNLPPQEKLKQQYRLNKSKFGGRSKFGGSKFGTGKAKFGTGNKFRKRF